MSVLLLLIAAALSASWGLSVWQCITLALLLSLCGWWQGYEDGIKATLRFLRREKGNS